MANQFPAVHAEFSLLLFIVISKSLHSLLFDVNFQ